MSRFFGNKLNNVNENNPLTVIPPQVICKADTGATRTYLTEEDEGILENKVNLKMAQ